MTVNNILNPNREQRRKVQKYLRKHPNETFISAFNNIYKTNYTNQIEDTSTPINLNSKEETKYE